MSDLLNKLRTDDLAVTRQSIIDTARRCFEKGLQTNAGGNLSVRLPGVSAIVIKPSGVGFNECTHENLMVADLEGNVVAGSGKPSKDLDFHVGIYIVRPDVNSVVHVHSPWATGWASAGLEIPCLTVQALEKVGRIPLIPLGRNGGPQGPAEISPILQDKSLCAASLANHGTIGLGKNIIEAQYRVEIIEETAHIAFIRDALMHIHSLGNPTMPLKGVKS